MPFGPWASSAWRDAIGALLVALGAAANAQSAIEIRTIRLPMSNVHLLKSASPVLVDAGRPQDLDALAAGLREHGVALSDIRLVLLTHGHSDHAGLASELRRRSGAAVVMGSADAPMAASGHHGSLQPTGWMGRLLARVAIDPAYPAFAPDLAVPDRLDLRRWGIEGEAIAMPGHTPGSLVVRLQDQAIVGDMILGGFLGGMVSPGIAGRHYFHADVVRNDANIAALLRQGVQTFHLGHGGPVTAASVRRAFPLPEDTALPDQERP